MAVATGTAMLIGSGIAAASQLGGGAMKNRAESKARTQELAANNSAMAWERQKYEDEKRAAMEDRAYRNAIRKAWAEKNGVNWSPSNAGVPGNSITLGGMRGTPYRGWQTGIPGAGGDARLAMAGAATQPGAEQVPEEDPEQWNKWT